MSPALNESQRSSLYAELASGAETGHYLFLALDILLILAIGWDYTSRWFSNPAPGNADLKELNVRNTIPVDLNSILCTLRPFIWASSAKFSPSYR